MKEYSLWQKIRIAFFGRTALEERKFDGWKGPIMFYAFNCPIHGIVEGYPHGYNGRLICPKCVNNKDEQ